MADTPDPRPIHFTQRVVLTVAAWPLWTSFTEEWLRSAHTHHATVDGDLVTFSIGNGTAVYELHRDLPQHGRGIVARRVEGDPPSRLQRAAIRVERA